MSHSTSEPEERITLRTGEARVFEFEAVASAGYQWVAELEGPVSATRVVRPSGSAPGAATTFRFEVTAGTAGVGRIRFVCKRPWESEALSSASFAVEIVDAA